MPNCPENFSEDTLSQKVNEFIDEPGMLNSEMRSLIRHSSYFYILNYCIDKAWNDAIAYEKKNINSSVLHHATIIKKHLYDQLREPQLSTKNYNYWHNTMCLSLEEFGMRYGIWQKLINMTFKYLYCFKNIPDINAKQFPWKKMHCPIDSIIAEKILKQMDNYSKCQKHTNLIKSISLSGQHSSGITWNGITRNQYIKVQSVIAYMCRKKNIPSNLLYDFVYWESRSK